MSCQRGSGPQPCSQYGTGAEDRNGSGTLSYFKLTHYPRPSYCRVVLLCPLAIQAQGETVAIITGQQVFSEVRRVARLDAPLAKRRAEAAKRVNQFKASLAAASVWREAPERQKESLRRKLQRAATRHDLTTEENSVYAEALDALMGQAH